GRKADDLVAPRVEVGVCRDQQRAHAFARERRECGLEFLVGAGLGDQDALIDAARRLLDLLQLSRRRRKLRVEQNADERDAGRELAQQPEPLWLHEICQQGNPGRVASGTTETRDQAERMLPAWPRARKALRQPS